MIAESIHRAKDARLIASAPALLELVKRAQNQLYGADKTEAAKVLAYIQGDDPPKAKTIYDLGLHEPLTLANGMSVMRVPTGWIYDMWDIEKDIAKSGIFVPYHTPI